MPMVPSHIAGSISLCEATMVIGDLNALIDQVPPFDEEAWKRELPEEVISNLRDKEDLPTLLRLIDRTSYSKHLLVALPKVEALLDDEVEQEILEETEKVMDGLFRKSKFRYFRFLPAAARIKNRLQLIQLISSIDVLNPSLEDLDTLTSLLPDNDQRMWEAFFLKEFYGNLTCRQGLPILIRVCRKSGADWQVADAMLLVNALLEDGIARSEAEALELMIEYATPRWARSSGVSMAVRGAITSLLSELGDKITNLMIQEETEPELEVIEPFEELPHTPPSRVSVIELSTVASEELEPTVPKREKKNSRTSFRAFKEFKEAFESLLDSDFCLLSSKTNPPRDEEIDLLEGLIHMKLPQQYRDFIKHYGGIVLEAKEDAWPREISGGPDWAYWFALLVFGIGDEVPSSLNVSQATDEFRAEVGEAGTHLVPLMKRCQSPEYVCLRDDGTLVKYHENGTIDALQGDFYEVTLAMTRELVKHKSRIKNWEQSAMSA